MTEQPKQAKSKRQAESPSDKPCAVYFLSLEVERVLCFKDKQILNLSDGNGNPAQWTVILGNNGVGKTTLLRCLASVEVETAKDFTSDNSHIILSTDNISLWNDESILGKQSAELNIYFAYGASLSSPNSIEQTTENKTEAFQTLEISLIFNSLFRALFPSPYGNREELLNLIHYGYGATRRTGETSLSEGINHGNSASLFLEGISLINAEEWLLQTDYSMRSASGKTRDRLQKQLNQIIDVLKRILPDVEDIQIAPADEERSRPTAEFLTPYGWVQLSSLGLGYRTMIAWMVDLAARLFQRYPDSPDPLAEPAIVLVDEIDLHLHPKWQRTIMNFLTERFPNTQFIVTAHSPLVVQAAKNANIVLLRREGDRVVIDNNPEIVDNWRVDQVLTSVFELPTARPADVEPLLLQRQELLSQAHLSEADEAKLRELEARIGTLPTGESPEDIKAMDIIRRAAKLLENS
uniref:ATPase AAA-type core domain-containing protein n=1 Tax=Cyanothece sp. (strain PCC 7425 / ATCC 29141) TaxID=395961 RepID=B8HNF3_CYAP4